MNNDKVSFWLRYKSDVYAFLGAVVGSFVGVALGFGIAYLIKLLMR